ncbi:MAG TPA: mechanosensitive ion channel domain-containing protein [Gemmatimonadaceae bacterium]|nr:mechanosensitive ion channel domain-containing protein [Gemmatimonadaceae bacterium]
MDVVGWEKPAFTAVSTRTAIDRASGNAHKRVAPRSALVLLVLVAWLAPSAGLVAQESAGGQDEVVTAPVVVDGTVLFRVRGVSSLSAADRARQIRDRLTAVAADRSVSVDSLRVVEGEGASRILAGDRTVLTVVDADARMELVDRTALTTAHLARIRQAIVAYRADRTVEALRRGATRAAVATLILAIALVVVFWIARRADAAVAHRLRARVHSVDQQSFEALRAERIRDAVHAALVALRTLAVVAIVLVYLGFVLAQFPTTRGLSDDLFTFALRPLTLIGSGVVESLPGLVFLTVLFFVFRFALRLIRLFFAAVEKGSITLRRFDPLWALPTYKAIRIAIIVFAVVVAYPYIPGSQSAAFKGISVFLGILFSLGGSSALGNVIAGYALIYRRAFRIGDRVRIGDNIGDVIETRMQVTRLRTLKNEELNIPNSQILASEVRNYNSFADDQGLILHTEVGIGYNTPWQQVEAMLIKAALRTTGLGTDPRPYVLLKKLGDFAVTYEINVYTTNVRGMFRIYTQLHRHILDVFNEYGVQIMTPAYEGDPDEPKVVPPQDWYLPPAATPGPTADGRAPTAP